MLPIKLGLLSTNLKDADKLTGLLKSMYDYTILPFENSKRSDMIRTMNAHSNIHAIVPDIKNAEQTEFVDHLIFVPNFADKSEYGRLNKPREYPTWNEAYERYDAIAEDDKMLINLNRELFECKNSKLARSNHLNETIMTKYNQKRMYILFGEITMPKLEEIHNDIVGKTVLTPKQVKQFNKGKK